MANEYIHWSKRAKQREGKMALGVGVVLRKAGVSVSLAGVKGEREERGGVSLREVGTSV